MKIAVAGTGYVGLSIATLLSQKNEVVALDVIKEKVELISIQIFIKLMKQLMLFTMCSEDKK